MFTSKVLLSSILGFGVAVLTVGMIRGESSLDSFLELRRSRMVMSETVRVLEETNKNLTEEISKIRESPRYARRVLRDKYHVTDEGERIVFFANK